MSRMRKIILSCMLVLIMLLLGKPTEVKAGTEAAADRIEIKIYYNNPCASCHGEKTYEAIAAQELEGISDQYPHDIWIYNCFKPSDKEEYLKDLESHDWEEQDSTLPMLILGDHKICGEKEIKAQLRELFLQEAEKQTQGEELQYFSTSSCKDCARVKELLQKNGWKAKEYSIDDADNLDKLYEYFQTYEVKEEDQQVPILFWNRQYYSGETAIEAALNGRQNTSSEIDETELAKKQAKAPVFTWRDTGKIILAGLVNGMNPCSASLLLFLLSLFVVSKVSVLKVGFSYLAGRFIAYLVVGLGIFSLGALFSSNAMAGVMVVTKYLFMFLAILLGGLNLLDYIHLRRQEFEKVRLQLPKKFKKWNYDKIRKVHNISSKGLVPAIFLLGFVISAGEFFCTGQLYAAVIVSMIQTGIFLRKAVVFLCIYIIAMCIPHAVLIGIVDKSKNILDASRLSTKQMPYYKLISAVIFLGFAVWILYSM